MAIIRDYKVTFVDGISIKTKAYDAIDAMIQASVEYCGGEENIQCPLILKVEPIEIIDNKMPMVYSLLNLVNQSNSLKKEGRQYLKKNKK